MVTKSRTTTRPGGLMGVILRSILRSLQMTLALVIAGIYGHLLSTSSGDSYHDKLVYGIVVAVLSIVTAAVYCIPFVQSYLFFIWDAVLFVLWVALFGVWGEYTHRDWHKGDRNLVGAVWVDLVCFLLWFLSAVVGGVLFWRARHSRSMFTGRAAVV